MKPERLAFLIQRRRERAKQAGRRPSGRAGGLLAGAAAVLLVTVAALVLVGGLFFADLTRDLPPPQALEVLLDAKIGQLLQPTGIYDRSGEHLLITLENPGIPRTYLAINEESDSHFSSQLLKIIIFQDDPEFWNHPGISLKSPLDSAPRTIAEKLVDRLLLSREETGWRRALRMHLLALQITSVYGREKILEWHLNSVYFGHLAYGADTAARLYFNKSASDLSLAEAALLAEIERAPALNPLDAPAAAEEQKINSLNRLLLAGIITPEEFLPASEAQIQLRATVDVPVSGAPAFTKYLLAQLDEIVGRERLEQGGLVIKSTLDYDLQTNLLCTLTVQIKRVTDQETGLDPACDAASLLPTLPPAENPYPAGLQAGGIMLDPQTGEILALAGRMDLSGGTDSISGMRSGSILTPLAALSAFTRGMGPATLVWDVPTGLPDEMAQYRQSDSEYQGPLRLRTALGNDILTPLTNLLIFLGPQDVLRQAAPLGLTGLDSAEIQPDFFYQGEEVNLVEIAHIYSAFAGLGRISGIESQDHSNVQPAAVLSIADVGGQTVWDIQGQESREVISPPLAFLIHDILEDENARRLSLGYPNALEIGRPAGAKVAAAAGGRESWAVGYTPQRLGVIWFGLPSEPEMTQAVDFRAAAGVWHAMMQYSLRSLPVKDWSTPQGVMQVEVCDPSGLLPSEDCSNIVKEVFLLGTEPTSIDTLYRKIPVNRETGRIATVFTPPDMVEDRVFINYPKEAREWALANGQPAVPEDYDIIQAPLQVSGVSISHPAPFAYIHGLVQIVGTASGEGFSSYSLQIGEGLNPANWQQIGEESRQRVEGGQLGAWDTRDLNGLYAVRLLVVQEDKKVSSAVIQVSVDNIPPSLSIPYPVDGQVFEGPSDSTITFQAEASDLIGVKNVEWFIDGQAIGERQQPPYSLPWACRAGSHMLTVKVYDLAGNVTESAPVSFIVK
ncbi:MAG: penicillin-binding protein [Anaerolineaceae bacterium]